MNESTALKVIEQYDQIKCTNNKIQRSPTIFETADHWADYFYMFYHNYAIYALRVKFNITCVKYYRPCANVNVRIRIRYIADIQYIHMHIQYKYIYRIAYVSTYSHRCKCVVY